MRLWRCRGVRAVDVGLASQGIVQDLALNGYGADKLFELKIIFFLSESDCKLIRLDLSYEDKLLCYRTRSIIYLCFDSKELKMFCEIFILLNFVRYSMDSLKKLTKICQTANY
jgi:hypothetical protein